MGQNTVTEPVAAGLACRSGYLPVPLRCVPPESLAQLTVHLTKGEEFPLYRALGTQFAPCDRDRLLENGVEFVYIPTRDHRDYYRTVEANLGKIVSDPHVQQQVKARILYATSIELAHELLEVPPDGEHIGRVENVAEATVEFVMKDDHAFARLFEVSNHDFYSATHMVNVCTYAVNLANRMNMDVATQQKLAIGCLLHDVGKVFVPTDLLNTHEHLGADQFQAIQTHVQRGCEHLKQTADLPEEIILVVAQHHERIDGSGYPNGLKAAQVSHFGRLVGVVDTFEAMTAVRPYRDGAFSVQDALDHLEAESLDRYDPQIVRDFADMICDHLKITDRPSPSAGATLGPADGRVHRPRHERRHFRLTVAIRQIEPGRDGLQLTPPENMIAHNVSRSGIGFVSPRAFAPDQNIVVSAPAQNGAPPINIAATIMRSYSHDNGWHTVGAQFHQEQVSEAVEQLRQFSIVA